MLEKTENAQRRQFDRVDRAGRSIAETALALGMSEGSIRKQMRDGTIPFVQFGRRKIIPESFFERIRAA